MKRVLPVILLALAPWFAGAAEGPVEVSAGPASSAIEGGEAGESDRDSELDAEEADAEEADAFGANKAGSSSGFEEKAEAAPFIYGLEETRKKEEDAPSTWIERGFTLMGYLVMIGAIGVAAVWLFRNNPRFSRARAAASRAIRVAETRPLGQKQFLTIVECDGQRMLLGISPGRMDFLCPLSPENNDGEDAPELTQPERAR